MNDAADTDDAKELRRFRKAYWELSELVIAGDPMSKMTLEETHAKAMRQANRQRVLLDLAHTKLVLLGYPRGVLGLEDVSSGIDGLKAISK